MTSTSTEWTNAPPPSHPSWLTQLPYAALFLRHLDQLCTAIGVRGCCVQPAFPITVTTPQPLVETPAGFLLPLQLPDLHHGAVELTPLANPTCAAQLTRPILTCLQHSLQQQLKLLHDQHRASDRARRWHHALHNSFGVWDWRLRTGQLTYSDRFLDMIGLEGQHEKKFRHLFKLIHPDDRSKFKRELKKLIEGKIDQFNCETRTRHSQGHYIWLHNRANVTDHDRRGACRIIGTSVDIQNRKTGEVAIYDLCQQLQSSETHYRELMKNANDAILISDMDNDLRIIDANHQASQLSGYSQEELLQKRYNELIPNPAGDCPHCNGGVHRNILLIDKDGRQHTIDVSCTRIDLSDRRLRQCIIHDISERKATEERLHHLAHHDPLTGLPNRTLFRDRLQQAILKANRHNTLVALCYFDLNNFKQINDTMGHNTGDQVLTGIARRLKQLIRTSDTAARLGGDEFIIILEELETPAVIKTIAAKILEQLNRPMQIDNHSLQITSSLGISIYPRTSRDLDTLIRQADMAMYKAKAAGNSLEVFDHDQP